MRLLLALCLAVAVLPRRPRRPAPRQSSRSSPPRTCGEASPRSSAGTACRCTSMIVDPDYRSAHYEPTASDARTIAGAKIAIVNGIGYDNWASQLLAADPVGGRTVVDAGDVLGLEGRRQPAPVVLAGFRPARSSTRSSPPTSRPTRPTPRYFAARKRLARDQGARALQHASRRDPPPLRRRTRRLQREHLRAARDEPRPEAAHPSELRQGDRRGRRGERPPTRQTVERQLRSTPGQGLGVQQPERDPRDRAAQTTSPARRTFRSRRSPRRSRPRTSASSSGRPPSSSA